MAKSLNIFLLRRWSIYGQDTKNKIEDAMQQGRISPALAEDMQLIRAISNRPRHYIIKWTKALMAGYVAVYLNVLKELWQKNGHFGVETRPVVTLSQLRTMITSLDVSDKQGVRDIEQMALRLFSCNFQSEDVASVVSEFGRSFLFLIVKEHKKDPEESVQAMQIMHRLSKVYQFKDYDNQGTTWNGYRNVPTAQIVSGVDTFYDAINKARIMINFPHAGEVLRIIETSTLDNMPQIEARYVAMRHNLSVVDLQAEIRGLEDRVEQLEEKENELKERKNYWKRKARHYKRKTRR